MRITDSHAHYDDKAFDGCRYELLDSLFKGDVAKIINIGCSIESSRRSVELTERYPGIFAAVGLHPDSAGEIGKIDEIRSLCVNEKVAAIGEIGLDYHYENHDRALQKQAFERQLSLAGELDMPVVIHSRDAWEDTLELVRKYRPKGVMHCFSGSAETAEELIGLGMYIGFTGVVTFKNAKKTRRALSVIPESRLLCETDCPYMAPEPHRGEVCHSGYLVHTLEAMGAVKGKTASEMADITAENAERLFGI
ncbi:MAG: TatD family hydrolase [Ruminococcus sp.]|nr:TatD family hydrolase [Ruminococcus sp.]